jgi:hypothetical protein
VRKSSRQLSARAEPEENMELKTEDLAAAQEGQHVKIQANGHTFYLLSQQAYDKLEEVDCDVMSKEEMDLLADEAHAIISEGETDEY